jgi:hypothetical protein
MDARVISTDFPISMELNEPADKMLPAVALLKGNSAEMEPSVEDAPVRVLNPDGTTQAQSRGGTPSTEPDQSPENIRSTSELKFSLWASIQKHEPIHPALYVVTSWAGHYDPEQPGQTVNGGTDNLVEVSQELPVGRQELPALIMITSLRLLNYIDFNIYDGSLPWGYDASKNTHYMIPQPFKILVFFNAEIRQHLVDLEETRRSIRSMTENEYDTDWRSNPPVDYTPTGEMNISLQTIPELTGLIKDFRALVRFMDHFITPVISRNPDDDVYFSDLWYAFPTSSLIYIKDKNTPQKIWRVIQRTGGSLFQKPTKGDKVPFVKRSKRSRLVIDCYCIDYDGNRYIPVYHRIFIDPFDGLESMTSLPAFPLSVAEDAGYIDIKAMVYRGRDFIECTRPAHRDYTGRNQLQRPNGETMVQKDTILPENASRYSEWIDSEVMVDIDRALHAVPAWRPSALEYQAVEHDIDFHGHNFDNDDVWDRKSTELLMRTETENWEKWDRNHPPSETDDLLLLPGHVFAFVFRTRKWGTSTIYCTP